MENSRKFYQQCVKQLLSEYEALKTHDSHIELIFDAERMRYMALWIGWRNQKRIHQCAIHINIRNDQIEIQWNDTEELLDEELIKMGIPQDHIRLETIPPEARAYATEHTSYSIRKAA